jgi:hypothetical protein
VDCNTDYDSFDQLNRDAEDKYFAEDDENDTDVNAERNMADYDYWANVHKSSGLKNERVLHHKKETRQPLALNRGAVFCNHWFSS